LGEDGATHQILEDIGLMKMLPNMTVVVPADYEQTRQATHAIAKHHGPVYLRFGRPKVPVFIKPETPFELGKIQRLMSGTNVTLVACGHMVWESIQAALILAKDGIQADVLNAHTVKPFDSETLLESVQRTGAVVVAEEHQVLGGLGGTVAQTLAKHHPTRMAHVAVEDQFGESGTPAQLMKKYGLDAENIVRKTKELLAS
jgi:transketolase